MDLFMSLLNWRDLLDIALVTCFFYGVIRMVENTRVVSALVGLMLLGLVFGVARYLGLYTLSWLLENLFGSLFLVLVILFHDDIRHVLARMGARSFFRRKKAAQATLIDDLAWICQYFARRRIGALIVIEGDESLNDLTQGGVRLDALLSRELVLTIFYPNTALHDGAVILRQGRILAAGCILPLARLDRQSFGTRHRAALGVTETCDAVVLVVSEERGEVSVARRGHLAVMANADQLRETLTNVLES